ncbi:PstS family phosphate ABC transporter substrate-binding protein [Paraglaciecola sp.]|uniref:PstS family phosphate ABC transporter substrate-binding protein n=1 Tax=Paraglaciecola sp. TaxID=1920173 RepID=UPI003EF16F50
MADKIFRTINKVPYIASFSLLISLSCSAQAQTAQSELQTPNTIHFGASKNIVSFGSDTLANLMHFWSKEFHVQYPKIGFELHSEGSTTAVKMLFNNQADLGPMSRLMTSHEVSTFKQKFGYRPTPVKVAMDALVMYVNRDNPLDNISLAQIDRMFSATQKCHFQPSIDSWQQLGLTGKWKNHPIELIGRNKISGTYGFFKRKALCNGEFKPNVSLQPGSTSLIQVISHTKFAIGFSGLGFKTSGVKALPLLSNDGEIVPSTAANVQNQTYPLARFLYIYINWPQSNPIPSKIQNFLRLVLSEKGQKVVTQDGYIPLSKSVRKEQLKMLRLPLHN